MKHNTKSGITVFAIILVSMAIVPGVSAVNEKAIKEKQFGDLFGSMGGDPLAMSSFLGSALGGLGGPAIFADIMNLIFSQIQNFNEQELLPNCFVFNASVGNITTDPVPRSGVQDYDVYAPYIDPSGNAYRVHTTRSYDVDVSFNQEAYFVFILWDDDGSFIRLIRKILNVVNAAIEWAEENSGEFPQEIVNAAIEAGTWALIHINDIITGDEQFMFQPSYYWSYDINGDVDDVHTWINATDESIVADPSTIPGLTAAAASNPELNYMMQPTAGVTGGNMHDSGFLFHMFQFWMQKFQIEIDMEKLGQMISESNFTGAENILEGVDVQFTFSQHHLLGGLLYNDTLVADDLPTVEYQTLDLQYTDSRGVPTNVSVPTSNEVIYKIDLSDASGGWVIKDPTLNPSGNSLSWGVNFTNPSLKFKPIGMDDYEAFISGAAIEETMDHLYFGFTFEPSFETLPIPDENGNPTKRVRFGKGTIKLDQGFGDIAGGLPAQLQDLGLAVIYFSHIFKFDFRYMNIPDEFASDTTHNYHNDSGTLDFLGAGDKDYFGSIDIAGPQYEIMSGPEAGPYDAVTDIVPIAIFNYTFEAERNIENDEFSVDQGGEAAFRRQSLYMDITSAWAFYVVAYPNWDGNELWHDPTFSTFMTLDATVPWAIILLIAVGGAIVAASIVLYFKKQGRF
ncbi:MAG: hypothetical protein ACTSUE_26955 [Promethearchaeota archaeon]